ncbi:NAD(P)H-dependent oxidoreductase subunit E [Candidatus Viridilinea mediisalina]|uniref:Uncharacterized protein n=1 Tax=Candidatus Viridilinea mediisalina TaxID=2024553 RepID=A0A2A6RM25_9CHLR|nr:NAD(P)H-dependent oxidoreductase subunit E [Candidatus Viridilinea mediisalina]PDW04154.1 hypothetical protein CJ255_04815 [Candidatus Viridilinea mediisalina]
MRVQLTVCRFCTRSRPEFCRTVAELAQTYPNEIAIEELDCMAACEDVPAVMIEEDYYAQLPPCELIRLVEAKLAEPVA